MGQIAFVFSGQGDQYPGMGRALWERYPEARAVFDRCDRYRPGTSAQCFSAPAEELQETRNTQPCLYAVELAAVAVLKSHGITPDVVAGFSLGEVAAAAVAGVFDAETGFRLVCRRGELMQQAAQARDTAMAAVVKLTPAQVEGICAEFDGVYPVNYNCPGQITVSGLAEQMPAFSQRVRQAGGRALPLKVRGGFHSPFMASAARQFRSVLEQESLEQGRIPLYSNLTGTPYDAPAAELLSRQISAPVRWEDIVRNMRRAGVDTFVELGPGKTLTNFTKKIDPNAKTYCVSELEVLLEELSC